MKKQIVCIAILFLSYILLCPSFNGLAAQQNSILVNNTPVPGKISVSLTQPESKELKFKLAIYNPGGEKVTIELRNKSEGVLHSRVINSEVFYLIYDMRELPDDIYTIEIKRPSQKQTRQITINTIIEESRVVSIIEMDKPGKKGF